MKTTFLSALAFLFMLGHITGQSVYRNNFSNLILQTYTTSSTITQYTTVPSGFHTSGDSLKNNTGSLSNPNRPFNVPALKEAGWVVAFNAAENDTFLVSCSWLDTTTINVDRWVVTPVIQNIPPNSVLTWLGKSPDASFPDGYEVYGTTNLNDTINSDFTIGDRLFYISDGNTAGQGEKSTWTRHSINLGPYSGQSMRFAFRNNSKDMYQIWIDDLEILPLTYSQDGAMQNVIADKYVLTNSTNSITVNIANNGATDISDLVLGYSINNSILDNEDILLSTPLSYGQSTTVTFGLPYTLLSPGYFTIKTWINSLNGSIDQNLSNDTALYYVTVQSSVPSKTILVEQFLSANNGESPDAQIRTTGMQQFPAVVVNIHGDDSLVEPGALPLITDYKKEYATALIDRYTFSGKSDVIVNREDYGPAALEELQRLSPAGISISNSSFNPITRELSFTVQTAFVGEVKGDYRINAYLTENNVCGAYNDTTINGFNQLNNYYTVAWSPYYELGYYSPMVNTYVLNSQLYKHQNTLIHTFNGPYGVSGIIPSTGGTQNQTFQQTFTVTIPPIPANSHRFNTDNIYIVGFLAEYSADTRQRHVLNAVQKKLNSNPEFVAVPEITGNLSLSVYPNPSANGFFYMSTKAGDTYDLKVYDLLGHCLKSENNYKPGTLDLSGFSEGMYLLTLRSGKEIMTEKLLIQKN